MQASPHGLSPIAVYNIWPANYIDPQGQKSAIELMTEDLARIKEMGFNVVYMNPFFKVGEYPKSTGDFGCPYAVHDMAQANPRFFNGASGEFLDEQGSPTEGVGSLLKEFCDRAKSLGITPMFDLVQGQLAPDSVYIERANAEGITLLKTHTNGNFDIHNLDSNYNPKYNHKEQGPFAAIDIWDDTVKFDYSFSDGTHPVNEFARSEIFAPYIDTMARLGFTGMRIDSSPDTPANLHQSSAEQFRNAIAQMREHDPDHTPEYPIIIAETLNNERSPIAAEVIGVATHCMDSGFFFPESRMYGTNELLPTHAFNDPQHWLPHEIMRKQRSIQGGAITPLSTHDTTRSALKVQEQIESAIKRLEYEGASPDEIEEQIQRAMRVKAAFSAFAGAGGMMMTSGDEFGTENRVNVFQGAVLRPDEAIIMHKPDGTSMGVTFSEQEYDDLVQNILAQGAPVTVDDVIYTVEEAYPKAIWQYAHGEEHEKQHVLMRLNHQIFIPHMVEQQHELSRDLSSFLKELNHAMTQSPSGLHPDYRAQFAFSEQDDKLLYCTVIRESEGQYPQVVALHAVNVDPQARTITMTEDQLKHEASNLFHHDMTSLAELSYIGAMSAKQAITEQPDTKIMDGMECQRVCQDLPQARQQSRR